MLFYKPWISGAWKISGLSMWTSTQSHPLGVGTLWELFSVSSSCFVLFSSAGGSCSLCLCQGMDLPGTATSLLKGMFQPLLGTPFGHSFVISRCLGWCLLAKWIERSRGLGKDLCCRCSDFTPCLAWSLLFEVSLHLNFLCLCLLLLLFLMINFHVLMNY